MSACPPTLEQLLERGQVRGALMFSGDLDARERRVAGDAYKEGWRQADLYYRPLLEKVFDVIWDGSLDLGARLKAVDSIVHPVLDEWENA